MKNTTKTKKLRSSPSKKTRWAYLMQGIEPTSQAINEAFPDYHPQWVQLSQKCFVSGENFKTLRTLLGLSIKQCSAYLRVSESGIYKWEEGKSPVSFAAFELLRLILESDSFKLSNPAWDGWFLNQHGVLHSPDIGGNGFTPDQLVWSTMTRSEAALLRNDVNKLQNQLDTAIAENTKLRQMYVAQGVVEELAAMSETIDSLMSRIATARVLPFATAPEQLKEKAA